MGKASSTTDGRRQKMIRALKSWYRVELVGRDGHYVPRDPDYRAYAAITSAAPTINELHQIFGCFRNACQAAGLPQLPAGPKARIQDFRQIEQSLKAAKADLGPLITRDEYKEWARTMRKKGSPVASSVEVLRFCGSWSKAAEIGEFKVGRRRRWLTRPIPTPEECAEVVDAVKRACEMNGRRALTTSEWREISRGNPDFPAQAIVKEVCGSFPAAMQAAGFEPAGEPWPAARYKAAKKSRQRRLNAAPA